MARNKTVIILRGPSGCGKSTWLKANEPDAYVCSADNFWLKMCVVNHEMYPDPASPPPWLGDGFPIFMLNGKWYEYRFYNSKQAEAHAWCMSCFLSRLMLDRNKSNSVIVVDNTNIKKWMYENYVKIAMLAGYTVRIVDFRVRSASDIDLCVKRNVHRVPADIVAKMFDEFEPDVRAEVVPIMS